MAVEEEEVAFRTGRAFRAFPVPRLELSCGLVIDYRGPSFGYLMRVSPGVRRPICSVRDKDQTIGIMKSVR